MNLLIAKSVHFNGKAIGLFYMDKHPFDPTEGAFPAEGSSPAEGSTQAMQIEDFNEMKKIAVLFDKQLKLIS